TRLSHLTSEQGDDFRTVWRAIDARRRRQVVGQLVDLAEDNVDLNFDVVFLVCLEDSDSQVRLNAVRGLWEYESSDLIPHLLRLLERDDDVRVRAEAALALGRFVLLSEYGNLRPHYFQQIEAALGRILADRSQAEDVRARALEAIGACSSRPWVSRAILEAYENGAHRLKVSAIHAMGRSCEARWLPILFGELSSDDTEARYEGVVACGSIGDDTAVPHVVPLLRDEDPEVRTAAIAALGEIGGPEARSHLLALADGASMDVREAVSDALSELDFDDDPLSFRMRR
ncbi:MAG: HEAT repeat domain-containing protein, partial [Dehalococcoidia bacterium]